MSQETIHVIMEFYPQPHQVELIKHFLTAIHSNSRICSLFQNSTTIIKTITDDILQDCEEDDNEYTLDEPTFLLCEIRKRDNVSTYAIRMKQITTKITVNTMNAMTGPTTNDIPIWSITGVQKQESRNVEI